jgi:hypothetical protein
MGLCDLDARNESDAGPSVSMSRRSPHESPNFVLSAVEERPNSAQVAGIKPKQYIPQPLNIVLPENSPQASGCTTAISHV